jgi:hypothetical protein
VDIYLESYQSGSYIWDVTTNGSVVATPATAISDGGVYFLSNDGQQKFTTEVAG